MGSKLNTLLPIIFHSIMPPLSAQAFFPAQAPFSAQAFMPGKEKRRQNIKVLSPFLV